MIVIWSDMALRDRRDHILYIAEDDPLAAVNQGNLIETSVDRLAEFPEMGRPGRQKGTRELVIPGTPFIAVYRIKPNAQRIELIRLLHGAQQWPNRKQR